MPSFNLKKLVFSIKTGFIFLYRMDLAILLKKLYTLLIVEVFSVQNQLMSGIMTRKSLADDYGLELKSNEILMGIMFNSMDVNYHNEVLMQEVYDFIGTVGGSLGLFIGFSYTGVIGQILDHFIKND